MFLKAGHFCGTVNKHWKKSSKTADHSTLTAMESILSLSLSLSTSLPLTLSQPLSLSFSPSLPFSYSLSL